MEEKKICGVYQTPQIFLVLIQEFLTMRKRLQPE